MKNIYKCPNCDAIIRPEAKFCHECGARLAPTQTEGTADIEKTIVCPNCGAKVRTDASFCNECGSKLDATSKSEFSIPLRKISFSANVSGMFAQVFCQQEFENQNKTSVEAIYIFPLPEEASVVGCEMAIGDKKIVAELKEQKQARQEYEDAISAGHHASLLEQKRENIFRISVGGIEPGESIRITTIYNQRVPWQQNGGRFTIPLVVAPRFIPGVPKGTKTGGGWAEDTDTVPDASEITPVVSKEGVSYTADIRVSLSPGFSCHISSPSHDLIVGEHRFVKEPVEIAARGLTPDRDFILCYQTESAQIEAGVHKGSFSGENFAAIDVIPPGNIAAKPKDIIFCLDVSGSMSGPKLDGLKIVTEKIARRLSQEDKENRIAVVAFESEIHLMHPLSKITDAAFTAIQSLGSMGGTYAGKALDYCFRELSKEGGGEKYILLVTDGQTEDRWSKVIPGIRVIAVGIDVAVNMSYLKDIAQETGGVNIAVYPGEDYDTVASNLAGLLSGPVLRDIKVLSGDKLLEDTLGANDVYLSMPASITLKATVLPDEISLKGVDSQGRQVSMLLNLQNAAECTFAYQIWAREKMRDRKLSETDLVAISLKYGVLCSQTAFVAIHLKEVPGAKPERVEIPVSLPYTWDYEKVFGQPADLMPSFKTFSMNTIARASSVQSLGARKSPTHNLVYSRSTIDDSSLEVPAFLRSKPRSNTPDELEMLVNQLEQGTIERSVAKTRWKSLEKEVTEKAIEGWAANQKAKAYYCLLKLRIFGFKVSRSVLKLLSAEPDPSNTEAHGWWKKAQQVLGVAASDE